MRHVGLVRHRETGSTRHLLSSNVRPPLRRRGSDLNDSEPPCLAASDSSVKEDDNCKPLLSSATMMSTLACAVSNKKEWSGIKWILGANFVVVLCLLGVISNMTSNQPKDSGESVEAMASKIIQLSREVGASKERNVHLETEENQIKKDLDMEKAENDRLKQQLAESERLRQEIIDRAKDEVAEAKAGAEQEQKLRLRGGGEKGTDELAKVKEVMQEEIWNLREDISDHDREATEDKFGLPPYRVEIKLSFPPNAPPGPSSNPEADAFIMEMASLDLMPHSVHLFLDQVAHKLWDGCSFHRKAEHIVQAGPVEFNFEVEGEQREVYGKNKVEQFRALHLSKVSFQEYAEDFPHVEYTVGFARSGPSWYINTRDNTRIHGRNAVDPGGVWGSSMDINHEDGEPDPCFAKIVDGLDAIDRLLQMPGQDTFMVDKVGITSARILTA